MPRNPNPHRRQPDQQPRELRDGSYTASGRLRRGLLTQRSVYRQMILALILASDRRSRKSREVRKEVERRLAGRFTAADLSLINDREPRWVNSMQWERKKMVMDGLLETPLNAGHGIWRLTAKGMRVARGSQN